MKPLKTYFGILFFILYLNIPATAQDYSFNHYQVEEGLSNNAVTCSLIDKMGFLWFGTKDGLNRYDGLNFKSYLHVESDQSSLGNDFINCLSQDTKGNLLVGTDRGLYILDYETEIFKKVARGSDRSIRAVLTDPRGNIWYIAGSELHKISPTGHIRSYPHQFASALCIEGGHLWVGLSQGLLKQYDDQRDGFHIFPDSSDHEPSLDYWVEKLYSDQSGKIYIGTSSHGVRVLDTKTGRYHELALEDQMHKGLFVRDFVRRSQTELWIATESGIFVYNESSGRYVQLVNKLNNPYSLSNNAVYTLLKDRQGGIWAGTYYGGINYNAALITPFDKYSPDNNSGSISGRTVREICKDKSGHFWVGTEDAGLNSFDPVKGIFQSYFSAEKGKGIGSANIHGLLIDGNRLWVGTFEHGLDVMDLRTKKRTRHYQAGFEANQLKSNFIYCIYKTSNNLVLFGTPEGLFKYNEKTDDFTQLLQFPAHTFYTTIHEDSHGNLWAGTFRDGLFTLKLSSLGATRPGSAHRISGLETERITSISESRDGAEWITTESGLFQCNHSGKILRRYSVKDGLPADLLYNCLEDEEGRMWISSSSGLIAFNRKKQTFVTYKKANGLLTDQFNYNSAYKDKSGKMYFGCVKGLIAFNPIHFKSDTIAPPVYITGFQVGNTELIPGKNSFLKKSILVTDEIELPYHKATFSIDFSALNFPSSGDILFKYRLEGLEKQWTLLRKNRRVYYTQVPPGKYTFMVRAIDQDRSWNTRATKLSIIIIPPFWRHPVAFAIYASVLFAIAYFLLNKYRSNLQKVHQRQLEVFENKKQQEIYQAKIEFFTNIAHEIRTPLTLIRVPMERLIRGVGEMPHFEKSIRTMERNTNRLLTLTNQLLDFRSTEKEAFSLNFVKVNVHDLVMDVWMNFQAAAEEQKISCELRLPEDYLYAFVDTEAFTKIVSNLIDNAIKFADKHFFLHLTTMDGSEHKQVVIKVGNDGNPLSKEVREHIFEPFFTGNHSTVSKKGTGIGLALARALTELHSGSLVLDEPSGDYNVFILTLPLNQKFEFDLNGKWRKK